MRVEQVEVIERSEYAWLEFEGEHWTIEGFRIVQIGNKPPIRCVRLTSADYKRKPDIMIPVEALAELPWTTLRQMNEKLEHHGG